MKRRVIFSFVLLFSFIFQIAVPNVQAQTTTKFDRSRYTVNFKKFVLDNGLTLIVHEDHSVPIVGVNMWYHVGSRNEQRGKTGFAHLFEHFFFNGSENHPSGFREAMDDLGANNRNGTTNTDRTNFFEDVPVSALERTLYLEADRMGFLYNYISQEMLERERGVVQNEKRQGENQPYGRVFNEISEKIYPYSHPYSWSTIGSMEDLNAARLDDVKSGIEHFTDRTTPSFRSPATSRRNVRSNSSKNISTAFRPDRRFRAPKNGFRRLIEICATRCRIAFRRRESTASISRRIGKIRKRSISVYLPMCLPDRNRRGFQSVWFTKKNWRRTFRLLSAKANWQANLLLSQRSNPALIRRMVEREMDAVVNEAFGKRRNGGRNSAFTKSKSRRISARHGTLGRFRRTFGHFGGKYDLRRFARFLFTASRMDGNRRAGRCQSDGEQMAQSESLHDARQTVR